MASPLPPNSTLPYTVALDPNGVLVVDDHGIFGVTRWARIPVPERHQVNADGSNRGDPNYVENVQNCVSP